jgi:hypothetical protein
MKPGVLLAACLLLMLNACRSALITELAASSGQSLFHDDFSAPAGGWPQVAGPDGRMGYQDGAYQMQVDRPNYDLWAFPGYSYRDVRIEVDATRLGGPQSNRFGLACRTRDQENFYFFIISSDGYYAIGKVEAGVRRLLGQDMMAYTTVILLGNSTNHLRFDCVDQVLSGYVNGLLVAVTTDTEFRSGDAGLLAGTFDQAGLQVAFDNFVVYKP